MAELGHRDPMLEHGGADGLSKAIAILESIVLPALQERVLDTADDATQGDFLGHGPQSKDEAMPTCKDRRRDDA